MHVLVPHLPLTLALAQIGSHPWWTYRDHTASGAKDITISHHTEPCYLIRGRVSGACRKIVASIERPHLVACREIMVSMDRLAGYLCYTALCDSRVTISFIIHHTSYIACLPPQPTRQSRPVTRSPPSPADPAPPSTSMQKPTLWEYCRLAATNNLSDAS